jgi:dTDP-4-amino-4,6-dideoxygalactose transaminase
VKFKIVLKPKQLKAKQDEALKALLEIIDKKEHEDFKKRWHNVQALLQNKPMKNQLISFLESQTLDPKTFPVKIDDLKKLRDNITHGSIDKVNAEQLRQANILLYRISGILILNLMGIKDWKLNTVIKQ